MNAKETLKVAAVLAAALHVVGTQSVFNAAEFALADIQAELQKTCTE